MKTQGLAETAVRQELQEAELKLAELKQVELKVVNLKAILAVMAIHGNGKAVVPPVQAIVKRHRRTRAEIAADALKAAQAAKRKQPVARSR